MRTRQKGFTLLEMVVVVAVIGILLGIAIPSYQNYVIRSNRTEGQALLSGRGRAPGTLLLAEPRGRLHQDVAKLGMSSANSPNNLYNLTIATPTSTTYTLTATPINSQTRDKTCGKLTLNQLGERGAAGKTGNNSTVNDCWR
ncbi:type IV pilin protein [Pseudomonas aeruginosa]|nr:type IV pilin protein [Pseudomonas aeruginosa]